MSEPTDAEILDAQAFRGLLPIGLPTPSESYAGEMLFQWLNTDGFAEVAFAGDGTISWFVGNRGRTKYCDEPFDRKGLPVSLVDALAEMTVRAPARDVAPCVLHRCD